MCSFSASPVPTPSVRAPPVSSAEVAAACATIARCWPISGQVTAVVTGSEVAWRWHRSPVRPLTQPAHPNRSPNRSPKQRVFTGAAAREAAPAVDAPAVGAPAAKGAAT
jgi:hypothetical protein